MDKKTMKDLWCYIIRTDDWDRYYWEVYVSDEVIHIASSEEEANEYLNKIINFIENKN